MTLDEQAEAAKRASETAEKAAKLSWPDWQAKEQNEVYRRLYALLFKAYTKP